MEPLDFEVLPGNLEEAHRQIAALKQELRNVLDLCMVAHDKMSSQHELEMFKMKLKFKVLGASLKQKEEEVKRLSDVIDRYYCKLERVW